MKKILLYAAMVLLSVTSCLKFEEPTSLEVQSAGAPTIEVSGLTENTFTATITPAAGTNFYAYAVLEGEVNPKVSASSLLTVKVGSDIAEGLVDVKNEATKTLALKGLVGNTKYTVYAAATNEQGQVASVTTLEVLTDDKTNPTIKAIAVSKVGQVQFTEPVKLVSGKKAWVTYYKYYDPADSVTMEIPAKNMAVKGAVLQLTPPKHIPGAYTIYTYEEGLVTDYVGQECPAQTRQSFKIHYDIMYRDSLVMKGVAGRIPTENWDFVWEDDNKAGDTTIYFSNPSAVEFKFKHVGEIMNDPYADGIYFTYMPMLDASISQRQSTDPVVNAADSTLTFGFDYPFGILTDFTLTIGEGSYIDLYGNINNEYTREEFASYIPCVSKGMQGAYYNDLYGLLQYGYTFDVEIVNDTTAIVYNLDYDLPGKLNAKYDKEKGTLLIPYGQIYNEDEDVYFYDYTYTRRNPYRDGSLITEGGATFELASNGALMSDSYYILTGLIDDIDAKDVTLKELYDNGLVLWTSYFPHPMFKASNSLLSLLSTPAKVYDNYVEQRQTKGNYSSFDDFISKSQKN